MILKAVIHEAEEGGFWAEVPALLGCFTQGETLKELEANIHEAIEGWLLAAEPEDQETEGLELQGHRPATQSNEVAVREGDGNRWTSRM